MLDEYFKLVLGNKKWTFEALTHLMTGSPKNEIKNNQIGF